jgi:hypothetical protein
MNWLHYLLEANLYLGVFYIGYYLFLSRETYYTLNRVYLLFSCVASFALPVFQLGILKPVEQPITAVNFAFTPQAAVFTPVHAVADAPPAFTWQNALICGYILGAAILLAVLVLKLYSLLKLTRAQNLETDGKYKLVYIDKSATAFSFFNYLFIGTKVQGSETIIRHELVHISQKHSADIIFIELLKIVNWFNPFIYLLQYSLKTIHEYIADEKTAIAENDALAYSSFLVNNAYGLGGSSITHSFFNYNLLKKRIIMLHQKRSGSLARLKYLVAVPICVGLLCASTLAFSKDYGWVDIGPHRIDKNNHSPQVAEPARHLLIRQNGLSYLTDKFSDKRADGSTRVYTAYNISNKNCVDLAKKGIQVSVIYDEDTVKTHIAPPPPPAPPVKAVVFPAPKHPAATTSKGYQYAEMGRMINGKTDMEVIIYQKGRNIAMFDKNKATAAQIALLKDKYGYVFPAHFRVPPPPPPAPPKVALVSKVSAIVPDGKMQPALAAKRAPVAAIVPDGKMQPASAVKHASVAAIVPDGKIAPPPPPPAQIIINDADSSKAKTSGKPVKNILYTAPKSANNSGKLLIIINGKKYAMKIGLREGEHIYFTASDSSRCYSANDVYAMNKWGKDAFNGVIELYGKTSLSIK